MSLIDAAAISDVPVAPLCSGCHVFFPPLPSPAVLSVAPVPCLFLPRCHVPDISQTHISPPLHGYTVIELQNYTAAQLYSYRAMQPHSCRATQLWSYAATELQSGTPGGILLFALAAPINEVFAFLGRALPFGRSQKVASPWWRRLLLT